MMERFNPQLRISWGWRGAEHLERLKMVKIQQ